MILINRVTLYSYEIHKTELYQCIEHNINNSFIDKIVIFSNNANIKLPNHEKVILVIKHKFSERDIVNYCKSRFNSNIFIYSNPFVKFDNSLIRVEEPDKECKVFNSDTFIFSNKSIIKFGDDIDNLFFRYEIFSKLTVSKVHNWTEDVRYDSTLNFKREILTNKEITIRKPNSIKLEEKIQDTTEELSDEILEDVIKPETKIVPIVRRQVNSNNLNENILVKKASKTNSIISKIDIIIVSVNYNDYLSITLSENLKYNKNITVVTTEEDIECQKICESLGVKFIISDRIYQNGDVFNKGKAINDGIKSLQNPEWILLLDADVFLVDSLFESLQKKFISNDDLIICKRYILEDYESFIRWSHGDETMGKFEKAQGFGFFQLFNLRNINGTLNVYPENYGNASLSDLQFRNKFFNRIEIDTYVVHLGETNKNWSGRISDNFITEFNIDNKINLSGQITFEGHRSGWQYAINSLLPLNSKRGILFDGFIENKFSWNYKSKISSKEIPYKQPWVGFFHNPQNMPTWFDYEHSPQEIIKRSGFKESLKNCIGIFALSEYHARWIRENLNVPVSVLYHPTETNVKQFNFQSFEKNDDKKIIQVGWWLRRLNSIYSLPIDSNSCYRKIRLETITSGYDLNKLYQKETDLYNINFEENFYNNTYIINHLSNDDYDDLLSENIVFLNLYDSSANNAVIECIARSTPLLVNPLPSVIEYLGEDYPFYFNSLEEAAEKATDFELIKETNKYLNNLETKKLITGENFLTSFKDSEVYKLI